MAVCASATVLITAKERMGAGWLGGKEMTERKRKKRRTTSGAKGLFLNAPPTARGLEPRAAERAL